MKKLFLKESLYDELMLDGWRQVSVPIDYYLTLGIKKDDLILVQCNSTAESCICTVLSIFPTIDKVVLGIQLSYLSVDLVKLLNGEEFEDDE
jgi:hypothetical protein